MKKMKKALLMCLSLVLVAALAIAGTVAYLTDTDSKVNVMTVGNVNIEQHEYERVVDENGNWIANPDDAATFGGITYIPDKLQEFTQNKPALPAVYQDGDVKWDDRNGKSSEINEQGAHQQPWGEVGAPGSNSLFDDSVKNVIDKFVFVENTGKSDAYYRTVIAIECPENVSADLIHTNTTNNSRFTWENLGFKEINGVRYFIKVATYNPVLTPGEISRPSLLQLFLDPTVTNDDCALFGDTWDVLVLSQAVQADGFADAKTALDTGFGKTSEKAAEWFGGVLLEARTVTVEGNDKAALTDAIENAKPGDIIKLSEDTTISGYAATEKLIIDKAITLDLGGNTITTESGWGGIDAKGGCSIINGTINHTGNTAAIKAFDVETIENVTINVTETAGKVKGGIVVQNGNSRVGSIKNVTINGATNGIQCYRSEANPAIGSMTNVTINATQNGIWFEGGGIIGNITDCTITAGDTGIRGDLTGVYSIALNIVNSDITGGKYGVDLWDEAPSNPGTVTFNYDAETTFSGETYDIKITLNEEVACTYQNEAQQKPCSILIKK